MQSMSNLMATLNVDTNSSQCPQPPALAPNISNMCCCTCGGHLISPRQGHLPTADYTVTRECQNDIVLDAKSSIFRDDKCLFLRRKCDEELIRSVEGYETGNSTSLVDKYGRNQKTGRNPATAANGKWALVIESEGSEGGPSSQPENQATFTTCHSTALLRDASYRCLNTRISGWQSTVSQNLTGKVVKISPHAVAGGAFSDVWEGDFDGVLVAIKVPRIVNVPAAKLSQRLRRELESWDRAEHKNILPLIGYCTDFGPVPCFISPWMRYGTVLNFLTVHPDFDRVNLLEGVASGLSYLHRVPIVHGDICGRNILVSADGEPCISDFGLSYHIDNIQPSTTPHGSVRWKAPERHDPTYFGLSAEEAQAVPSDVWSFGMTVLELITGNPPYFDLRNDHLVVVSVLATLTPIRPTSIKVNGRFFEDLWLLCSRCWNFQPQWRPSMKQVHDKLLKLSSISSRMQSQHIGHSLQDLHMIDRTPSLGHLDGSLGFLAAERARAVRRVTELCSAS